MCVCDVIFFLIYAYGIQIQFTVLEKEFSSINAWSWFFSLIEESPKIHLWSELFFKVSHLKKILFLHLSIDIINSTKDLKKRNSQMEITKTKQKKLLDFKKNPFAFLQQQKDLSPGAFFWKKNIISNQTKLNIIKKKSFPK